MRVLIRADASTTIGSGHVARCLALATVLRQQGAEVQFACRQLPGHLLSRLIDVGYVTHALPEHYEAERPHADIQAALPWQADIDALSEQLAGAPRFDWLIVDHYGLDAHWETASRRFSKQLMAIDDLANRPHAVDLLLDQNYSAVAIDAPYGRWVGADCRTLLGPRYALLRDEFQCGPIAIRPRVERVLVNFGGFDAARQVYATALALQAFEDLEVDFVAGLHNPEWEALCRLVETHPNWRVHTLVSGFSDLMRNADLFIGAGGGTTWERAALGLPTICISVAENQQLNARLLAEAGAHLYLGAYETLDPHRLTQAVAVLRDNVELRHGFACRSRELVDGKGALRVAVAMAEPVLALRSATQLDAKLLFDGRNAGHVRRWAFNADPIDWDGHVAWLQRSLDNPQRLILIGENAQGPIGMTRYDREDETVEVSIYLFAGQTGVGWGRALLTSGERFLRRHWPDVRMIDARVIAGNAVSESLFQKAGYCQTEQHFQRVIQDE